MKIQLPNGRKMQLDESISFQEKESIVENLMADWNDLCRENWHSNSVKFFLDSLANYLIWHKEQDKKWTEDKEILSIRKIEEMSGKRQGKSINFTNLSNEYRELLGLERESQ